MYRILSASKDTYITDKFIAGSRSLDANVGQAGTLDLFKLYNETSIPGFTGSVREVSRLLLQFDYSDLQTMRSQSLDITDSNFQCILHLKDVYGGQTTPSNFEVVVYPLSKSFSEGRGSDVIAFRDIDAANFLTASIENSLTTVWEVSGAAGTGSLGETADIVVSGNIGSGFQDLGFSQNFLRGDEDLYLDVTPLVSASLAGMLDNNGFRISFSETLENDSTTYFVKRFGSRHTLDKSLHPRLIVKSNDQIQDEILDARFNTSQSFFTYNQYGGEFVNFFSGSTEITGNNSLVLELAASHSVTYTTTSYSITHSASINHLTRSVARFSTTFSASQFTLGSIAQPGIYTSNFLLNSLDPTLSDFLSGAKDTEFKVSWKSLDGNLTYATGYTTFRTQQGNFFNTQRRNWVVNITNLDDHYTVNDVARLRVFVQDYDTEQTANRIPSEFRSTIIRDMRYRLVGAYDRKTIIPFDEVTKLSFDEKGMYFDLWIKDLNVNEVYELQFMIKSTTGKDKFIENEGFRFKVVK